MNRKRPRSNGWMWRNGSLAQNSMPSFATAIVQGEPHVAARLADIGMVPEQLLAVDTMARALDLWDIRTRIGEVLHNCSNPSAKLYHERERAGVGKLQGDDRSAMSGPKRASHKISRKRNMEPRFGSLAVTQH